MPPVKDCQEADVTAPGAVVAEIAEAEASDEALFLRMQEHDPEALRVLYQRYARLVYSVCFRVLRDSTEAEDVTLIIFKTVYGKCKSFDPAKGAARSWLIQLAYHKCFVWRDNLKARPGKGLRSGQLDALLTNDPHSAHFVFRNASVAAAFKTLSKEQQLALELFYIRGYTLQDIAEKLGCSHGNVRGHLYRGLERLCRFLYDGAGQKQSTGDHRQRSHVSGSSSSLDTGAGQSTNAEVSDEVLLLRLQKGHVQALGPLYQRYAKPIYSVCFRILRDPDEAEDVVQKIFECLPRKCGSFDPAKGTAPSWIIQLAYSQSLNHWNYLKHRHGRGLGAGLSGASPAYVSAPAHDPDPAYVIFWNASMAAAFKSLSGEQQATLLLHYFEGYTFQEIVEKLGYSYGNVKHHVYRGIERLRHVLFDVVGQPTAGAARLAAKAEPKEMAG